MHELAERPDAPQVRELVEVEEDFSIAVHHDGTLTEDGREAFRDLARALRLAIASGELDIQ